MTNTELNEKIGLVRVKSKRGRKAIPLEQKKHKMLSLRITKEMFKRAHNLKKATGLPLVGIFERAIAKLEKEICNAD